MELVPCMKTDCDQIRTQIAAFWGDERTRSLHHPRFIFELGRTAYVIREHGLVVAYRFGFLTQTAPVAYVHLVDVRQGYQRQGLTRRLYERRRAEPRVYRAQGDHEPEEQQVARLPPKPWQGVV